MRAGLPQKMANAAAFAALGLALAGCASSPSGVAATSPSLSERMATSIFGSSAPAPAAAAKVEDIDCPVVDVRSGASTITIYGSGEPVATNVRYQATIGEYARECSLAGGNLSIKVGVQGRIILGPVGHVNSLDVPLRIALVEEGPAPKTHWTKLYRLPVTIPPGDTNVPFVHVEPNLSVPRPPAGNLARYVIYVGFDKQALGDGARSSRRPHRPR